MSVIITAQDLESYTGDQTLVAGLRDQAVSAVNQWIENRTNRCWGEVKTVTERYDWAKSLFLRHQDIDPTSVVIKVGYPGQPQTILDATGYFVNTYGRVTMYWLSHGRAGSSFLYNDYLEITYDYGSDEEVPDDLKFAALGIAAQFYNWASDGSRDLAGISIDSYQIMYAVKRPDRSASGSISDANWAVVDSYRMRRV